MGFSAEGSNLAAADGALKCTREQERAKRTVNVIKSSIFILSPIITRLKLSYFPNNFVHLLFKILSLFDKNSSFYLFIVQMQFTTGISTIRSVLGGGEGGVISPSSKHKLKWEHISLKCFKNISYPTPLPPPPPPFWNIILCL